MLANGTMILQRRQPELCLRVFPCIGTSALKVRWQASTRSCPVSRKEIAQPISKQRPGGSFFSIPLASDGLLVACREENRQLRAQLRQIRWPPLTSFVAYGKTYALPFRSTVPCSVLDKNEASDLTMRYLAGFFDGDGCCYASCMVSTLQVSQSFDRADILVLFVSVFGGSIYREGSGQGLHKPLLYWQVAGSKAIRAARILAPYTIVKRRQLVELAQDWPRHSVDREACVERLKHLKQYDSSVDDHCTWEYVAGFFDAEGHIHVYGKCSVGLQISQKFITVLECVSRFLSQELGCNLKVKEHGNIFRICITTTSTSKSVLRNMLAAGMVQKAEQAHLALSATPENGEQVRSALFEMTGNQCFGRRRDKEGLERARQIVNVQARAKSAQQKGHLDKASCCLQQIQILKADHALQKARLENSQLKEYTLMLRKLQHRASFSRRQAQTRLNAEELQGVVPPRTQYSVQDAFQQVPIE